MDKQKTIANTVSSDYSQHRHKSGDPPLDTQVMENLNDTNYTIENFNPLNKSGEENREFISSCQFLFDQGDNFRFLSMTGIKYTEEQHKIWQETFNPDEKEYLIALDNDNGKMIGLSILLKNPLQQFEISGLVVDNHFRRNKIGSRLLSTAEEHAKTEGFKAIHTKVFCDNLPMLSNVIQRGYKPILIEYHKRFDGEDLLTLVKYF